MYSHDAVFMALALESQGAIGHASSSNKAWASRKSACCGEAHGSFGAFLSGMPLAAQLMEYGTSGVSPLA